MPVNINKSREQTPFFRFDGPLRDQRLGYTLRVGSKPKAKTQTQDPEPHLKKISPALEKASEEERNIFEISPAGYGINWPLLDEDISIDGLLGIVHVPRWKKKIA
jgi:hypothetical protein